MRTDTLPDRLCELAARLRRTLAMDRSQEPFFAEIDEIERDLRRLARKERAET